MIAKADSGASSHYWLIRDKKVLLSLMKQMGPTVYLPNNTTITATEKGSLPIKHLSPKAAETHVLPGLKNSSLISLGQLCDDGCVIHLTKTHMRVFKEKKLILTGIRNHHDGLWDVPLPQKPLEILQQHNVNNIISPSSKLNVVINKSTTKKDLALYYHACCFSPTKSTFINAIKLGHFSSWPGLTVDLIQKHLPESIATTKGHLRQERQNLYSTKPSYKDILLQPKLEDSNQKTLNYFASIISPTSHNHEIGFLDLTGKFPYTSGRGNKYLLIMYDFDSNGISVEPLTSRHSHTIIAAWKKLIQPLIQTNNKPKIFILDNEISTDMKSALKEHDFQYQLVPPDNHRRNAAERAIQTFKNHFISGLASLPNNFPITEWDRLLPQAQLTLNLLRQARTNPNHSAYSYINGEFNFNRTPLAPPGIQTVIHNKPSNRSSWGYRGEDAFYVGPSMEHYRCVRCYIPKTRSERTSDTVVFFPTTVPVPQMKLDDYLHQAALDIMTLLSNPPKDSFPTLHLGDNTKEAIRQISILLNRATIPPNPSTLNPKPKKVTWKNPISSTLFIPLIGTRSIKHPPKHIKSETPHQAPTSKTPKNNATSPRVKKKQQIPRRIQPPRRSKLRSFRSRAANFLQSQLLVQNTLYANHILHKDGTRQSLDSLITGENKHVWINGLSNELGRLAQGNKNNVEFTDTIEFILKSDVPQNSKVTYANFVCTHRPLKTEPWRVRLVAGGDKLEYEADAGSPAASLLEAKLLFNSVISDAAKGARFFSCDLKDFFLASPMKNPEYMRIHYKHCPQDIRDKYALEHKVAADGYVYVKIKKGMYGLKQAAILAYDHLKHNLGKFGYSPLTHTPNIWKHKTRRTLFCLCVDDFGVKYFSQDDANHLINALKSSYKMTVDWTGNNYCGLNLKWNYKLNFVDIDMPGYIAKVLKKYNVPSLPPQHSPHTYNIPVYGKKTQFAPPPDTSPTLSKEKTKRIQGIIGSLLYYARAIDSPILPALNELSAQQAHPTSETEKKLNHLLAFVTTYPNSSVRFHASDMCLHIDSDAAYLVMPGAKSRIAGYYYLSSRSSPSSTHKQNPLNGAILVECKTLRHVVASAAESETGGLFHNAQTGIPIRITLEEMNHPQPATPLKTDNSTATSFVHSNMKQKRSKSWDMRYHWLRDRSTRNQFDVYWDKGSNNHADYFTKHHSPMHHHQMRQRYLQNCNFLRQKNIRNLNVSHSCTNKFSTCARVCYSTY